MCVVSDELKKIASNIDVVKPVITIMNKYKDNCYLYTHGLSVLSSLSIVGK